MNRSRDFNAFAHAEFAFDTLVLVSLPLNKNNVGAFINAICILMSFFAENNMPLRGAIGVGDYASDEKGTGTRISLSTTSKALSRAEQQQQWSGCYVLPEHELVVASYLAGDTPIDTADQSSALCRYRVPRRDGKELEGYCLNWVAGVSRTATNNLFVYMTADAEKRRNTEAFVAFCRSRPRTEYISPPNFRPAAKATVLWCGGGIQVSFWDENGDGVTSLGCKHIVFDPRQLSTTHSGATTRIKRRQPSIVLGDRACAVP